MRHDELEILVHVARPLITHLGLGDNIVQLGLAVTLAERFGPIAFPCYDRYETSVKSFFAAHPLIEVYTLPHQPNWTWGSPPGAVWDSRIRACDMDPAQAIRAGVYAGQGIDWDFTRSFYLHAGVPYEDRWDKCPIPIAAATVAQLPPEFPSSKKIFLHDDVTRGYVIRVLINRHEAFIPNFSDTNQSILRYTDLVMTAREIHVIDSAFFHFVNSFPWVPGKLYLHQYPRWPRALSFRYPSRLNWHYVPFA